MARRQKKPRSKDPSDTPMMRQYLAVKQSYPDAILFYRMGDFYETFYEDAETISRVVSEVKQFRDAHGTEDVKFRLATGNVGVMAATNEEVEADRGATFQAMGVVVLAAFPFAFGPPDYVARQYTDFWHKMMKGVLSLVAKVPKTV